ncbi:MAG: aminotransferase class I/II-fold pyridoxal phosphate-dependent enzyme [Acidimicrobiales bacterium]
MTAHGGDGVRVARALGLDPRSVLDLSASLNPVAPDVRGTVAAHLDALSRYPDPEDATQALACALDVDPRRVLLTNGGAEAIALVAAELGSGWVAGPEFGLYSRYLPRIAADAPRWRSDPHNPSGALAAPGDTAAVWDEAFYPLATGRWTSGRADSAIVLGSLTKLFACPGLRVGFVLAEPRFVDAIRERQPQWALNGLAAAALPDILRTADLLRWAEEVARLRDALVCVLRTHGLEPRPSDANYVLVPNAAGLRDRMARQGVVIRDCSSFGLVDHVRIAVPDDAGRARVTSALEAR